MAVFNFPYHTFSTDYPVSGVKMKLGNSYESATEPTAPDQRVITLNFRTMIYYVNIVNNLPVVNIETNPLLNMGLLEKFYNDHKLWKRFQYPHPVYGLLWCTFESPLKIPDGLPNGGGAIGSFSLRMTEQP